MIAHYLLHPDMKHGMDILAETYLNYRPISITSLIGKKGKNQLSMRDIDPEKVSDYAAEDADITWQLKEYFEPLIKESGLESIFYDMELPLTTVLSRMEAEGINLNVPALTVFSKELGDSLLQIQDEIHAAAGVDFNIDSPRQLGEILFDHMKIEAKVKKTKTGQYSTSEDVLSKIENAHPVIPKILEYRSLKKLKSTYVDALPALISPVTKHIHTSYMQTVAATGRLSSTAPNLQNIPIRTEKGREIRKAFIPRDEDHVLLAADYSQIELRIIAALSKDEAMIADFKAGVDVHSATAARVFDVKLEDVDRAMRGKAKMVNFGIVYGISAFGLSQRLNIPRKEAKQIIDSYFEKYSGIKNYMDKSVEVAKEKGYVETLLGRKRILRDINSSNAVVRGFAERNAINAPIQGSAADIIKIAMIKIHDVMKEKQMKSKMLLQVHDELVFDVHKTEVEEMKEIVKEGMESAVEMEVPLLVEMNTGSNWLEAH